MNKKDLRKTLIDLAEKEQEFRKVIFKQGHVRTEEELELLRSMDAKSTDFMNKVVIEYGLPTIPAVGKKASMYGWLLVQHSKDLDLQKKYLALLKVASMEDVEPKHAAYLEDRINMYEGKPQIYGTQVVTNKETGKVEPYTISDPEKVNERRVSVGLESLEDYLNNFYS